MLEIIPIIPVTAEDPSNESLPYHEVNPTSYDRVVCFFSSGKDSVATVLHLLDLGVDPARIELHHHLVDGLEGSHDLMDWPVTADYCRAFARAFNLKLYFSWKRNGFEGELLRNNAATDATCYENPDGTVTQTGGQSNRLGTRRKFPQVSADLSVRWCSPTLKIDVGSKVIGQSERFRQGKTLVITGERAEESASRAKYATFEPYRADNRNGPKVSRYVDHWRPIHKWCEREVWSILERYRVMPHPAYRLGWSRASCRQCIFGSPNQWATIRKYFPEAFNRIAAYEVEFGLTIHRTKTVVQLADLGVPYECDPVIVALANSTTYNDEIIVTGMWVLPVGAFGETCGPQ